MLCNKKKFLITQRYLRDLSLEMSKRIFRTITNYFFFLGYQLYIVHIIRIYKTNVSRSFAIIGVIIDYPDHAPPLLKFALNYLNLLCVFTFSHHNYPSICRIYCHWIWCCYVKFEYICSQVSLYVLSHFIEIKY